MNPEISSGLPIPEKNRYPQPASRTELQATPATKASDPAFNPVRSFPSLSWRTARRVVLTSPTVLQARLASRVPANLDHHARTPIIPLARLPISRLSSSTRSRTGPHQLVRHHHNIRTARDRCCRFRPITILRPREAATGTVFRLCWYPDCCIRLKGQASTYTTWQALGASTRRRDPPRQGCLLPYDRLRLER